MLAINCKENHLITDLSSSVKPNVRFQCKPYINLIVVGIVHGILGFYSKIDIR